KSTDDEYFRWVVSTLAANCVGTWQAHTKVARAHGRRPALGQSIVNDAKDVTWLIAALAQNIRQQKRCLTVLGLQESLTSSHLASIDTTLASRSQAPFVGIRTSLST